MHTQRLDAEVLNIALKRVLKYGVRAAWLVRHAVPLVELVCPAGSCPDLGIHDRALRVEQLIRQGIEAIGGQQGEALRILLCLAPGTVDTTLTCRRRQAGDLLEMDEETFRRPRHEGMLLFGLAMEVYAIVCTSAGAGHDHPTVS